MKEKYFRYFYSFQGNDHVIFNGSFYYASMKKDIVYINRVDPNSGQRIDDAIPLPECDTSPHNYLYKSEKNHVDVMADENGVWAVCATKEKESNNNNNNDTLVWKFNTTSKFHLEKAWSISVKHQDAGDMFIICGILYAVDNVTAPFTTIR